MWNKNDSTTDMFVNDLHKLNDSTTDMFVNDLTEIEIMCGTRMIQLQICLWMTLQKLKSCVERERFKCEKQE